MPIKALTITFIKVVSTLLITGAVFLEVWHLASGSTAWPSQLMPIVWIGRFAVGAHFIEGLIAAAIAPSQEKSPVRCALYTFFVGTVGLVELMDDEKLPGFLKTIRSE